MKRDEKSLLKIYSESILTEGEYDAFDSEEDCEKCGCKKGKCKCYSEDEIVPADKEEMGYPGDDEDSEDSLMDDTINKLAKHGFEVINVDKNTAYLAKKPNHYSTIYANVTEDGTVNGITLDKFLKQKGAVGKAYDPEQDEPAYSHSSDGEPMFSGEYAEEPFHDETDMSNPAEKKEVTLAKEILNHVDTLKNKQEFDLNAVLSIESAAIDLLKIHEKKGSDVHGELKSLFKGFGPK